MRYTQKDRSKSLRDLLVRGKLKPDTRDDNAEARPCGKARCKTCKMITPTQIAVSGAIIKLRCNTSCKTTNVVYLIICTKCGKQYVGETGDDVNQWMNGHWDDLRHKRFERSPVAEHFCSPEYDFINHASLCCLDHNSERSNHESPRELMDPTSEHSTDIWYQQRQPIEGITVPWSGHATVYVDRFVHVIFRNHNMWGLLALSIDVKHSVWRMSLSV